MTYFGVMHNIFEILPGKENKDVPPLFPLCVNMYTSGYLALFRNSFRRGFRLVPLPIPFQQLDLHSRMLVLSDHP